MQSRETHLMVLWENARNQQTRILDDLVKETQIRGCFEIIWSRGAVRDNFKRFYGANLPSVEQKVEECGGGAFLLVVFDVANPMYSLVKTSRGHETANMTVFNLKAKYRAWTGGCGHRVHATNSPAEFEHDLLMLLGLEFSDFQRHYPQDWDGRVIRIERDVLGCAGWRNEHEFFSAMRLGPRHVFLRGLDAQNRLPNDGREGDIDILTDRPDELRSLLGGRYHTDRFVFKGGVIVNPVRGKSIVRIGSQEYLFDVFDANRQYYDPIWTDDMLNHRRLVNGVYRLREDDWRMELLYHGLYHKSAFSLEQKEILFPKKSFNYAEALRELKSFLAKSSYIVTVPRDQTICFNTHLLTSDLVARKLASRFELRNIEQVQFEQSARRGGLLYYTADSEDGKVFVKKCRNTYGKESVAFEFAAMEKAWGRDHAICPRPIRYCDFGGIAAICMEYVEGMTLTSFLKSEHLRDCGDLIASQFVDIVDSLAMIGMVHRDVRPDNLIVDSDGHVKLIDFQFSVFVRGYREFPFYRQHPECVRVLGGEYVCRNYSWDDAYSFAQILELLPNSQTVAKCKQALADRIGRCVVNFSTKDLTRYKLKMMAVKLIPFPRLRHEFKERLRGMR